MSMYLSVLKCKVRLVLQDVNFLRSLFSITDDNVKVGNFGKCKGEFNIVLQPTIRMVDFLKYFKF